VREGGTGVPTDQQRERAKGKDGASWEKVRPSSSRRDYLCSNTTRAILDYKLESNSSPGPASSSSRCSSLRSFAPLLALSSSSSSTATHRTPSLFLSHSPFSSRSTLLLISFSHLHLRLPPSPLPLLTLPHPHLHLPSFHPTPRTGQSSASRATRGPALHLPRLLLNSPRPFFRLGMEDHQLPSPAGTQLLVDVRGAEIVSSHSEECVFFLLTLFFLP
jgi:hypothetical protein